MAVGRVDEATLTFDFNEFKNDSLKTAINRNVFKILENIDLKITGFWS